MATSRIPFEKLTPIHPNRRITLETGTTAIAQRLIDLFIPIGFGQHARSYCLLSEKTTILRQYKESGRGDMDDLPYDNQTLGLWL